MSQWTEEEKERFFEVDLQGHDLEIHYFYAVHWGMGARITAVLDRGVAVDTPRFGHGRTALMEVAGGGRIWFVCCWRAARIRTRRTGRAPLR